MIEFKHERELGYGCLDTQIIYKVLGEPRLSDIMQEFRRFLLAVGFQPDNIEEYIPNE